MITKMINLPGVVHLSLRKILAFFAVVAALTSCSGSKAEVKYDYEFYSGRVALDQNGSVYFTDCATNISMSLIKSENHLELREKLYEMAGTPEEDLYIEFTGRISRSQQSETLPGAQRPQIAIDSLLKADKDGKCDMEFQLPGLYEYRPQQSNTGYVPEVTILRLKPDYTYTLTNVFPDDYESMIGGVWYRNALLGVVLEPDDKILRRESYTIVPTAHSLGRNSGGEPMVFRKVYL